MHANQTKTAFTNLFNAITARQGAQASKDNIAALNFMMKNERGILAGLTRFHDATISALCAMQDPSAKGDNFIAVKANVKVLQALCAIGQKSVSRFDSYSATIIAVSLNNAGICFAKTALVALSDSIEYTETDQTQLIRNRMRVAASTASTQRSSTREMLRALGLATVTKAQRDDSITLTDKGAKILRALFKGEEIEEGEETEASAA